MRRFYSYSLFVWVWGFALSPAIGQSNLLLYEETSSGEVRPILDTIGGIVDANSTIRIVVKQADVQDEIFRFEGISERESRLGELRKLNTILAVETEILDLINQLSAESNSGMEIYRRLAELEGDVFAEIEKSDALYNELAEKGMEANEFVESGKGPFVVFAINFLEGKAEEIREELYAELEDESDIRVYFRLAAFIKNKSGGRPVHIENFDDYDENSYKELELFSAPLSAKDQQTITDHKQLTETLKGGFAEGIKNARKMLVAGVDSLFTSEEAIVTFRDSISKLKTRFKKKPNVNLDELLDKNISGLEDANLIYTSIQSVFTSFSGKFSADSLEGSGIEGRIQQFEQRIAKVLDVIPGNLDQFEASHAALLTEDNEVKQAIFRIRTDYSGVRTSVDQDISKLRKFINDVKNLLNPFKKAYLESEEIGNEVRRFTASNIPDVGYLDLRFIGERKPGDEILIKAVLEKGEDRTANTYQEKMLYRRFISIARVAAHVKMSGSLILANPYNRGANTRVSPNLNQFQFAPTYGIFMKWGSRKSKFYNEFINLGIGMAFSSPDFNLDGTPEFGAALMFTGFRDILGGGWGYNFGANAPYVFVGFNIPFNVGGLGGIGGGEGL